MRTKSPTIKLLLDKTKKRKKDGRFPLFIHVNWKGTRAKETAGVYLTEEEYINYISEIDINDKLYDRINELKNICEYLIQYQHKLKTKRIDYFFSAKDILSYG